MAKKIILLVFATSIYCMALADNRWSINAEGGITWNINGCLPHNDHVEMSGLKVSTVLYYGVDSRGSFVLNRRIIWPMLRTVPNDTHGSLIRNYSWNIADLLEVNGETLHNEKVKDITLNGMMIVHSTFDLPKECKVAFTRIIFPSVSKPAICEKYILNNIGKNIIRVELPSIRSVIKTDVNKGVYGSYTLIAAVGEQTTKELKPGESISFSATYVAYKNNENEQKLNIDQELQARQNLVSELWNNLMLDTPNQTINQMFAFSKIRGAESIYDTKAGLMHSPGGECYYAAIWANDEGEYVGPFFPFLGYNIGNRAALNTYILYSRYINKEYKPLPSSIIAEGTDIWNGVGDEGDGAMLAYGASRYALAHGNKEEAEKIWPLIEWTLEYCRRHVNRNGVVTSDCDELEHRFPSGKANLNTSSFYYDALLSAVYLGGSLGKPVTQLKNYTKQAGKLKRNIERYFGRNIEGFDTYRYYDENFLLRSWICMPLVMGIYDRKDGTVNALFSSRMWTDDGLLTQEGSDVFWDRSTLYALRGIFACGETEKALHFLEFYSNRRLLGEHVPYAIEAWPEGDQRHLSAESTLYCRVITEGLFGIRPTGLHSFAFIPRLPKEWNYMNLHRICAFGNIFDIHVNRFGNKLHIDVVSVNNRAVFNKTVKENETVYIEF